MKCFILISFLIGISFAQSNDVIDNLIEKMKTAGATCKVEVGATDADIDSMKAHEIPSTSTGKCFLACIYKKLDFMTEDGKFIKENGYNFIEKLKDIDAELYGKFIKLADTCYAEVEEMTDSCETATNMLICVEREKEVNGIPHWDL